MPWKEIEIGVTARPGGNNVILYWRCTYIDSSQLIPVWTETWYTSEVSIHPPKRGAAAAAAVVVVKPRWRGWIAGHKRLHSSNYLEETDARWQVSPD